MIPLTFEIIIAGLKLYNAVQFSSLSSDRDPERCCKLLSEDVLRLPGSPVFFGTLNQSFANYLKLEVLSSNYSL